MFLGLLVITKPTTPRYTVMVFRGHINEPEHHITFICSAYSSDLPSR